MDSPSDSKHRKGLKMALMAPLTFCRSVEERIEAVIAVRDRAKTTHAPRFRLAHLRSGEPRVQLRIFGSARPAIAEHDLIDTLEPFINMPDQLL